MTIIMNGIVCDNTCVGFQPGDITPDVFLLFGGGELNSKPFTLNLGPVTDTLIIGGHSFTWAVNDPHFSIGLADPSLGFARGTMEFIATSLYSPAGFAGPEVAELCPITPGVPEPATWVLMLLGFGFLMWRKRCGLRLAS